jgi:hypothetical protein
VLGFCLTLQQRFWNLPTKTTQLYCILLCPAAEFLFELRTKPLYFGLPRNENLLNCEPKHCILVCQAAKILTHKSKSTRLYFVLPRSERFWNLPTKPTQLYDTLFCRTNSKTVGGATVQNKCFSSQSQKFSLRGRTNFC